MIQRDRGRETHPFLLEALIPPTQRIQDIEDRQTGFQKCAHATNKGYLSRLVLFPDNGVMSQW